MTDVAVAGVELPLAQLDAGHWHNPRGKVDTTAAGFRELVESIRAQGILEPIVVGPALPELDGRRPIIAGGRRFAAAGAVPLDVVPVHVRDDIADERAALRAALAENIARQDMTPVAEASAIAKLVKLGDTQVQAAAAVGVSERTARERLRLLDLPKPVRDAIDRGVVPTTCTRQLQVVADACPQAATAIARKMAKGTVKALDVVDPGRLSGVLRDLAGVPLLELRYARLDKLSLSPAVMRDLKARALLGESYNAGFIDFGQVPRKLLDEARAAGALLELDGSGPGMRPYIAGAAWIERVAIAAVERYERQAAREKREREKARVEQKQAKKTEKAAATADPAQQALREHEAAARALDARAMPHAAAMNTEIVQRLHDMRTCAVERDVAWIMVKLAAGGDPRYGLIANLTAAVVRIVDPDGRYPWGSIAGVKRPDEAAARIVALLVAAVYLDPRATGDGPAGHRQFEQLRDLGLVDHVHAAARRLKLLPERAVAWHDARERWNARAAMYDLRGARRRVLFDLTNGPPTGIARSDLRTTTKEWRRDVGGLADVDIQVWSTDIFNTALEQLLAAGDVEDLALTIAITEAGRATLKAPPGLRPIIDDIDVDAAPPELPAGTPATDELQPAAAEQAAAAADPGCDVVIVHVTPTHGDREPLEAELQPDMGKRGQRKVIYTASRTASWVAESRIVDLPVEAIA